MKGKFKLSERDAKRLLRKKLNDLFQQMLQDEVLFEDLLKRKTDLTDEYGRGTMFKGERVAYINLAPDLDDWLDEVESLIAEDLDENEIETVKDAIIFAAMDILPLKIEEYAKTRLGVRLYVDTDLTMEIPIRELVLLGEYNVNQIINSFLSKYPELVTRIEANDQEALTSSEVEEALKNLILKEYNFNKIVAKIDSLILRVSRFFDKVYDIISSEFPKWKEYRNNNFERKVREEIYDIFERINF